MLPRVGVTLEDEGQVQGTHQCRQTGRQTESVLVEFSSIHSFTVPVHRFLIMACPHSGSAPLLSPPGCPSVHLRDRLRCLAVLTTVWWSPKQLWIHFSHSLASNLFSKLPIRLRADIFSIILSCVTKKKELYRRPSIFFFSFYRGPNQHAVNKVSFCRESVLERQDAHRLNIFIRAPADTNLKWHPALWFIYKIHNTNNGANNLSIPAREFLIIETHLTRCHINLGS